MSLEIHLAYTSYATSLINGDELRSLAKQSQSFNEMSDISGLLLYGNGQFFQLLEGPVDVVEALYFDRIVHDARHQDCEIVLHEPCEQRLFPKWGMGQLYLQSGKSFETGYWETLCLEIARQDRESIFMRMPAVNSIHDFIQQATAVSA